MEKIKKFITKHDELFFIILFLILIIGDTCKNTLKYNWDEIWNFQNIYKMYNGYKIYIDANVITTPLFFIIGVLLFRILGANFFVFKIYNVLIWISLMIGIFKIFKNLKMSKIYALLFSILIYYVERQVISAQASYNVLAIVFAIYGILTILNKEKFKNNFIYIIIEAIMIFLCCMSKQNVGIYYIIGYLIYAFIVDNNEKKNVFKIFIMDFLLVVVFFITLHIKGILKGFINYAVLGLFEFGQKNIKIDFLMLLEMIILVAINIILMIMYNKNILKIGKEKKKKYNILLSFAFPLTLIAYPIFNNHHIKLGIIIHFVFLFSIIYEFIKELKINKKQIKIIIIFLLIPILIISMIWIRLFSLYTFKKEKVDYKNVYYGEYIDKENKEKINNIIDFIENSNKRVISLSPDAAFYMMPMKRSNGAFDLLLMGNMGFKGEERLIEKIKNSKNTIYLLNKEEYIYQESEKIREYVKNNLNYIGEIENLEIYEKN